MSLLKHGVFAYGSLTIEAIRKDVLGYEPKTIKALLKGFALKSIIIGEDTYPILFEDPGYSEIIDGEYFEVDEIGLEKLDAYETPAYRRKIVNLENRLSAWVYIE